MPFQRFHAVFISLTFKLRARSTSVRISQASRLSESLKSICGMTWSARNLENSAVMETQCLLKCSVLALYTTASAVCRFSS